MSEDNDGIRVRLTVDLMVAPSAASTSASMWAAVITDHLRSYQSAGALLSVEVTPEVLTRRGDYLESLPSQLTAGEALEAARSAAPEHGPMGRYMHLPPEAPEGPGEGETGPEEPQEGELSEAEAYMHDFELAMEPFRRAEMSGDPDMESWIRPVAQLANAVSALLDAALRRGES